VTTQEMGSRVVTIEGEVDAIEGEVDAIEGEADAMEGEVDAMEGEVVRWQVELSSRSYHAVTTAAVCTDWCHGATQYTRLALWGYMSVNVLLDSASVAFKGTTFPSDGVKRNSKLAMDRYHLWGQPMGSGLRRMHNAYRRREMYATKVGPHAVSTLIDGSPVSANAAFKEWVSSHDVTTGGHRVDKIGKLLFIFRASRSSKKRLFDVAVRLCP
jgi:hypothetical protein